DVLRTEVGQHLDGMRAYLARDAAFDAAVDDELVRSVHTLHGAIAMVGVDSLATMLAPLEVWIRRVRSADAALDREGCDALRDAIALTEHVMAQFDAPVPDVPDTTALTERLEALRNRWPEASPLGSARHAAETRAPAAPFEEESEDSGIAAVGLESASTLPTEDDATALAAREAAERAEQERIAAEQAEQERLAAERAEQERAAAEKAEQERLTAEQAERERLAAEQAERERIAAEQAEQQRLAEQAEQAEQERLAAEQAEQERIAAEKAEQERLAAEEAEAERVAAEQAERERIAAEQAEQERIAAEKAEQERLAAEQAERERLAAEQAERDRIAAEEAERARIAAERAEQERAEQERAEQERLAVARAKAEKEIAASAFPPFPDDAQPEGDLDIPGLDPELVELFTEEGSELLDASDGALAALRAAPGDAEAVRELQRNLHTLKGGARVVGIASVGDLAHAMETLLEKIGDSKRALAPVEVDSLERGFDRLHDMVERIRQGRAVAAPVNAIERFNALADGRSIVAGAKPAAPAEKAKKPA